MALIPTDQRSQIMLLLAIVALFLGYVAWDGLGLWPYAHSPQRAKINATSREVDSLAEIVRRAEEDLASRTVGRSEEHTSELQSRLHLVCPLLPEKKKMVLDGDR